MNIREELKNTAQQVLDKKAEAQKRLDERLATENRAKADMVIAKIHETCLNAAQLGQFKARIMRVPPCDVKCVWDDRAPLAKNKDDFSGATVLVHEWLVGKSLDVVYEWDDGYVMIAHWD